MSIKARIKQNLKDRAAPVNIAIVLKGVEDNKGAGVVLQELIASGTIKSTTLIIPISNNVEARGPTRKQSVTTYQLRKTYVKC